MKVEVFICLKKFLWPYSEGKFGWWRIAGDEARQCGCAAYDGGDTEKKCLDCNYTPVKNDQSGGPVTNAMPVARLTIQEKFDEAEEFETHCRSIRKCVKDQKDEVPVIKSNKHH